MTANPLTITDTITEQVGNTAVQLPHVITRRITGSQSLMTFGGLPVALKDDAVPLNHTQIQGPFVSPPASNGTIVEPGQDILRVMGRPVVTIRGTAETTCECLPRQPLKKLTFPTHTLLTLGGASAVVAKK